MGNEIQLKAPLTINWAVTNSCNFRCKHCYSRVDTSDELATDVLLTCIEKASRDGVLSLNFGGGEPLMRQDLYDIAAFAASRGLRVSMNSNGFLITREIAKKLKETGFSKIGISIDSHLPEVHDGFRGVPGSYGRAVESLSHLSEVGIKTSLSTVICKINHHDLDRLIEFALTYRVMQLNFHNFKCSGLGYTNRDELDLTPGEWKEFYRKAVLAKERISLLDISLDDPIIASLGLSSEESLVKGSICGKLSLNIKSNGDITPCGFIPIVIGNIVRDDLKTVWRTSPVLEKMRNKHPTGKCMTCSDYADCLGGCSARALAITGDMNSPDPHCWVE